MGYLFGIIFGNDHLYRIIFQVVLHSSFIVLADLLETGYNVIPNLNVNQQFTFRDKKADNKW